MTQAFAWPWELCWWRVTIRQCLSFDAHHAARNCRRLCKSVILQNLRPVWLVPFGIVFEGVSLAWFYLIQKERRSVLS